MDCLVDYCLLLVGLKIGLTFSYFMFVSMTTMSCWIVFDEALNVPSEAMILAYFNAALSISF